MQWWNCYCNKRKDEKVIFDFQGHKGGYNMRRVIRFVNNMQIVFLLAFIRYICKGNGMKQSSLRCKEK